MARNEDMERRLLNWARWRSGLASGGLGYASVSMEARVDGDGYDAQAVIPTIDVDASVMDTAVLALPGHLRATVEMVYLAGGTMRRKAERLVCTEDAMKRRVWAAHAKLSAWFADRHARAAAARARVEALQRSARP